MKRFSRFGRARFPLAAVLLFGGMAAGRPAVAQEAPALRSLRMQFQSDRGTPRLILLLSPT